MTDNTPDRAVAIQQLSTMAQTLYEALESQDIEQILTAQQSLSATVETIWAMLDGSTTLSAPDKAIVRLLAGAAMQELPEKIKDPANHGTIKKDLRLLKSSAALL